MSMPQQQPLPMGAFDPNAQAPPPYTAVQQQPGGGQVPVQQQNTYPQIHPQMQQQVMANQQQFQAQQPQFIQSGQGPQPMIPGQQPLQYPPNVTPQQQQQIQQLIQTLPPEKLQMYQQQAQQMMPPPQQQQYQQPMVPHQQTQLPNPHFTTTAPSGLFGPKPSSSHTTPPGPKDEKQTGKVQRFFGDTLFGRVGRASVQTVTSTLKMPASLSPWGDNNPVTLPNVRYRDAILFTTFAFVGAPLVEGLSDGVTGAFGADSFISEIVSSGAGAVVGSTILKYSVFQIVEQALDKGILEHMLPEEEKMLRTTHVKSLQVGVKHKLMGVDADIRFSGMYPARDEKACEKGWFCPYLFASARTPQIPRNSDFAIGQFFGPFLGGDYALAHKLLSESAHVLSLCDASPTTDIGTNRLLLLFTGISPYRGNMWSTSRRPGCGTIVFHLLDGCPALVLPVTNRAPICAWSPWTLAQMRAAQFNSGAGGQAGAWAPGGLQGSYSAEWQHEQLCEFLDSIVSVEHLAPSVRERYVEVLGRSVSLVINGALALEGVRPLLGKLDAERAGIVAFRY